MKIVRFILIIVFLFTFSIVFAECDMFAIISKDGHYISGLSSIPDDFNDPIDFFEWLKIRSRNIIPKPNDDGYGIIYYKDEGYFYLDPEDLGHNTQNQGNPLNQAWYQIGSETYYTDGDADEKWEFNTANSVILDSDTEATIVLSHARNGVGGAGNHPFRFNIDGDDKTYTLMHNGWLTYTSSINNYLEGLSWFDTYSSNWEALNGGDNPMIDSEILFHYIMKFVIENNGDIVAGIHEALTQTNINGINIKEKLENPVSYYSSTLSCYTYKDVANFVMSDGENLYLFRNSPSINDIQTDTFIDTMHVLSYTVQDKFTAVKTYNELDTAVLDQFDLTIIPRYGQPFNIPDFLDFSPTPLIPSTCIFPSHQTLNIPQQVTVDWKYVDVASEFPTGFKVYKDANEVLDITYDTDKIYTHVFSNIAWGETITWRVVPYNENGDFVNPEIWEFTVMEEPDNPDEVPSEVVYTEQIYSGSNPAIITLPAIDLGEGNINPTFDFLYESLVTDFNISILVQDQPSNPLPNPENCAVSFTCKFPTSIEANIKFDFSGSITPDILLYLNDTVWEDVTSSSSAVFGVGSVEFNWTSAARGNETFVVNKGGDSPLPVSLSSFTAIYTNGSPCINWATQSESDNVGWNVYRGISNNMGQTFILNTNTIPGSGSTTEPTYYSYTDEHPIQENHTYWYWLESICTDGETDFFGPVYLTIQTEGGDIPEIPLETALYQNFPNPFNPSTLISFDIKENKTGELSIYNIKGQLIINEEFDAGRHQYPWDARDQSSGVYFYRLQVDRISETKKMVLVK